MGTGGRACCGFPASWSSAARREARKNRRKLMHDVRGPVDVSRSRAATRLPLGLGEVRLEPGFWRRRQELNAAVNLPAGWEQLEAAGTLANFRIAAGRERGRVVGPPFHDSDLYKWLEAAGWQLAGGPLPELER